MDINFKNDLTVTVQMKDYLQQSIIESELSITHKVMTPPRWNLFDIDGELPLLEGKEFDDSKVLYPNYFYIAIRARLDMLLPIAFLCT